MKIICEKHGDITDTAFHIEYLDNKIIKNKYYCLICITEMLDRLLENSPKVKVTE